VPLAGQLGAVEGLSTLARQRVDLVNQALAARHGITI
jgi:hypothetical protein